MTTPVPEVRTRRRRLGVAAACAGILVLCAGALFLAWKARRTQVARGATELPAADAGKRAPIPAPAAGRGTVAGRVLPAGIKGEVATFSGSSRTAVSEIAGDGTFALRDLPAGTHYLNYRLEWDGRTYLVEVHDEGVPPGKPGVETRAGVTAALRAAQAAFAAKDLPAYMASYSGEYDDAHGIPIHAVRGFHESAFAGTGPGEILTREAWLVDLAGDDTRPVAGVRLRFKFRLPTGDTVIRSNDFVVHFVRQNDLWRIVGERKLLTGAMEAFGETIESRALVDRAWGVVEVKPDSVVELPDLDFSAILAPTRL